MDGTGLLQLLDEVATAVRDGLDELSDWGRVPDTPSQYRHDVVADTVAVPMLVAAGLGVLSEESGLHHPDRELLAVLDPVDGSTNASMGLPWFATSIAVVDAEGPVASLVRNQALGVTYTAIRGQGAHRDGARIAPTACADLADAIVVVNDLPPRLGARQFRVYGAAALDLCAVADGTFDGFVDCGAGLSPWDLLGGAQICVEAGAHVGTRDGTDPWRTDPDAHVPIVAASSTTVLRQLSAVVNADR